jgi:hypothetical protein
MWWALTKHSFFDDEIVKICDLNQRNPVIVAGLDMDFKEILWTYACFNGNCWYSNESACGTALEILQIIVFVNR